MNSIINHLGSKGIDTGIAELGVYEGTFELAINNTFEMVRLLHFNH